MIKAYARSDVGKIREKNEDYYSISESLDEVQLYILADGMGGSKWRRNSQQASSRKSQKYILNNFKEIEKRQRKYNTISSK